MHLKHYYWIWNAWVCGLAVVLALWPHMNASEEDLRKAWVQKTTLLAELKRKWPFQETEDSLYTGNLLNIVCTRISLFLLHPKKNIWYVIYFFTQAEWKSKGHPTITEALSHSTGTAMVCYRQSLYNKDLWQRSGTVIWNTRLLSFFLGPLTNLYNASRVCCSMFLCACHVPFHGFLLSFRVWNKHEIPILLSKRAGKKFLMENINFILFSNLIRTISTN